MSQRGRKLETIFFAPADGFVDKTVSTYYIATDIS